jgi:hypothetical protein
VGCCRQMKDSDMGSCNMTAAAQSWTRRNNVVKAPESRPDLCWTSHTTRDSCTIPTGYPRRHPCGVVNGAYGCIKHTHTLLKEPSIKAAACAEPLSISISCSLRLHARIYGFFFVSQTLSASGRALCSGCPLCEEDHCPCNYLRLSCKFPV